MLTGVRITEQRGFYRSKGHLARETVSSTKNNEDADTSNYHCDIHVVSIFRNTYSYFAPAWGTAIDASHIIC